MHSLLLEHFHKAEMRVSFSGVFLSTQKERCIGVERLRRMALPLLFKEKNLPKVKGVLLPLHSPKKSRMEIFHS